jgi:hypothetical protein
VVLAQIAVGIAVGGNSNADGSGEQPVRFMGGIFRNHGEDHLSVMQKLQSLRAGDQLAIGWKNGGDPDQILRSDTGVAQGQFERSEPFPVFSHPLGEKQLPGNHVDGQFRDPPAENCGFFHNLTQAEIALVKFQRKNKMPDQAAVGHE